MIMMKLVQICSLVLQIQSLITSSEGWSGAEKAFTGRVHDIFPDEGELVEVKYVTRPNGGEFHIIEMTIPSIGLPISIHMITSNTLSPHLSLNESGTEIEAEVDNCFHSGHISGYPGGTTALSDCGDHKGFSGHMLIGNDHFVIEPVPSTSSESQGSGTSHDVILHRVYRSEKILARENASVSDMLIVPEDVRKKAVEEMNRIQGTQEAIELETLEPEGESDPVTQAFASKIPVAGGKVVEIAVFSDAKLMSIWKKRFPKDTKAKLKLYILSMVHNMNLLYQQASLGVDLTFRVIYLEMMEKALPGMSEVTAVEPYLTAFGDYQGTKNKDGLLWDHALMLTGFDISGGGEPSVAGVAYFETMCLNRLSLSVIEASNFGSTFIMTHEIGHSLAMAHDGDKYNADCDKDTYILSPTTGPGKVIWSPCSSRNLKDFILKGSSTDKENLAQIPVCITRASSLKNKKVPFSRAKLPGQVYSMKAQCQYLMGTSAINQEKLNECRALWCQASEGAPIIGAHSPLEGSPCAPSKYCRHGKCIKMPKKA